MASFFCFVDKESSTQWSIQKCTADHKGVHTLFHGHKANLVNAFAIIKAFDRPVFSV